MLALCAPAVRAIAMWPLRCALVRCVLVLCVLVLCVRCAWAVCFGGVVVQFLAVLLSSLIVVANIALLVHFCQHRAVLVDRRR